MVIVLSRRLEAPESPVRIGCAWGLQPVKQSVVRIADGLRLILCLPFHEYGTKFAAKLPQ
jgi:hypothetical protein